MKSSAELVEDVIPVVITTTLTVPAVSAGGVAVSEVDELKLTLVAADVPNSTVDPEAKWVPVIATEVPPAVGPAFGETPVTEGALR